MCKFCHTNRVLKWRLIFEEYGTDTELIKNENNIPLKNILQPSYPLAATQNFSDFFIFYF